ncbi:DNA polymerase-4 [Pseudoxanthobacter soli DSM 19599]|uniref:DNA polymerase IV n=1 Tax=Pseudoxanthobacter soli DSM 19599 TaxID=1123029 RepID=A0A1M7Z5R0_9HYPH|nr:DNA polymerase IV [Pseudoxanthobacter soli]SHO60162.1 DNA polymerase-4 [Pseudoxanthobacter soli DSM 19599]
MAEGAAKGDGGSLCRDCGRRNPPGASRCAMCGSPRLLAHPELDALAIAHIDCDAFYATIEKRDDPSLRDKPLIVGGAGRRGVVATACYIARIHGVRSAMPTYKARELCPDAVIIRPDMEKYAAVGRQVRAMMLALTPLVEPLSIDEAFLDLSGTERLHGASPAEVLARFARQVEREIGITVSVGLSYAKFLAKIASDVNKPRGFFVIGRAEAPLFLAPKPVTILPGIGKAAAAKLTEAGLTSVGTLATCDPADLFRLVGSQAMRLARFARGEDDRSVTPDAPRKSIGAETTFSDDISDPVVLSALLRTLSEKASRRLKAGGLAGWTVTLKLKTPDFRQVTRARRLSDPTCLADRIHRIAVDLLSKEPRRAYRLIGVTVSDLVDDTAADPPDLVDTAQEKRARAERAMDAIRARFGKEAVETGLTFTHLPREKPPRR